MPEFNAVELLEQIRRTSIVEWLAVALGVVYIILIMLAVAIFATRLMERSKLGYCLKAIRGDRDAAEALGINPTRYTTLAFAISAFMTALGGSFYAQFFRYINPERNMGLELSIDMAVMSIRSTSPSATSRSTSE